MDTPRIEVPDQFNIATAMVDENVTSGRGDRVAIYYGEQRFTYRDVQSMVNKMGNALKGLGLEPEQRVLLLLLDCPEFVASFFGAIKIGAVPIPTNTMMKPADYEYFLNDSRAPVLVVQDSLLEVIEPIRKNLKYVRQIVVVGEPAKGYPSYNELTAKASADLKAAETSKDDSAFWLYSSGSTGFPKGAVHLHHDIIYAADLYARQVLGITENDIMFSAAKLFFAYGLGNNLYFPFRVGAAAVLYPGRPLPDKMFEVITRYRPTIYYGVPTLYGSMLQYKEDLEKANPEMKKVNELSSVRLCVSAGEALPADIFNRWKEKFGVEILDGIGSTEVLHIFLSNRPAQVNPGSSGTLVPGYEARIVDEKGIEQPVGEIGNLMIKGESTCAYYWNKHQKTKETILGEWINTGDKYYQDKDGYFWYCGRADDMLKVGGIWVSPVEVENTLIEHSAVLESAVVGHVDEEGLVKPKAFVVLKPGYKGNPDLAGELQNFVKSKIALYKYPRWIEFVDELPKTATGKIRRFVLRSKG